MDSKTITPSDIHRAMKLSRDIQKRANELESEFYHFEKDWRKQLEKLDKKFNKK